jgi:dTDP-4-dehydrorhamnose reductase
MTNVWVIGAKGMLGSKVVSELTSQTISHTAISRSSLGNDRLGLNQETDIEALSRLQKLFGTPTHIVNAIGVVKPRINETNNQSVLEAIQGNSIFPRNLGTYCERNLIHLIQIATDCVYSGIKGNYLESDSHDPTDVYGKTKSLGEFTSECLSLIRCSIIGSELENKYSLAEWVSAQEQNATINGFTNHNWNGVTTKVFGMLVAGFVTHDVKPIGNLHLVPSKKVSKFELVNVIKKELGREDITVNEYESPIVVDRTLATELSDLNKQVWKFAGFSSVPTIPEMVNLGL